MLKLKPKILFIMHTPPPVHGASMVGKYIQDSEFINSEFNCFYINPTTAKNLEDIGHLDFSKITSVLGLCKRVERRLRELRPDLVYFTANAKGFPFYKDWLVMKSIKKALGGQGKVVVHYHNKGVLSKQDSWIDNVLYKSFFKGVKVILLADTLYSDIKKYVGRDDVSICPNGIPTADVSTECCEVDTHRPLNILFLSNMMKEKGVFDLLHACGILKKQGIAFCCDFVGGWKDIDASAFAAACEAYDVNDVCTAHGAKYGEDKYPYWQKADVFVFPTFYHNECFPLVLLEAMRQGKACISTDEAGIPSIIDDGKTGIIVAKNNPDGLAGAVRLMAENRELCQRMGIAGRKKFEEQFTLEQFERNFAAILAKLCG